MQASLFEPQIFQDFCDKSFDDSKLDLTAECDYPAEKNCEKTKRNGAFPAEAQLRVLSAESGILNQS
jgi:hypothetical protein